MRVKSLKYILVCLIAAFLACIAIAPVSAAKTRSDIAEGNDSGMFTKLSEGGSISDDANGVGVTIEGAGTGSVFEYALKAPLAFGETRASVNLLNMENTEGVAIYFNLNDSESASAIKQTNYLRVKFGQFKNKKFSASLQYVQPNGTVLDEMKYDGSDFLPDVYKNSGKACNMQFFLGTDEKFAYDVPGVADGSLIPYYTFRSNKLNASSTEIFEDDSQASLYQKVKAVSAASLWVSVEGVAEGAEKAVAIDFMQASDKMFYPHTVVPPAYVVDEFSVAYSKITLRWNVTDYEDRAHQGYILGRYDKSSGALEKTITYKTKASSMYNDSGLTQGKEYIYRIGAYANLNYPVPTLIFQYEDFEVTTKSGGITIYIVGFIVFAALFALMTCVYVYWHDIKGAIKKKRLEREKNKNR